MSDWRPSRWDVELAGCLWMQRMLDKGRRALEIRASGGSGDKSRTRGKSQSRHESTARDPMNGYLFGNASYMDRRLLKFLRTDEARVTELLQEHEDDAVVAEALVRESGRSPRELEVWNRRVRRRYGLFMAMCDADEGLRSPGWITSLLKFAYTVLILPPVYVYSRWYAKRRAKVTPSR